MQPPLAHLARDPEMEPFDNRCKQPEHCSQPRGRLLAAAMDLFASKGYSATSVREIVAAAGLSKPALYYYFSSKEGIYLALMDESYSTFREQTALLSAHQGSARERVVNFCTGIFDCFLSHINVARIIYSIYFGPPQGAPPFPHERFFNVMLETIGGLISEGINSGELRKVDESAATWAVISGLNSAMEEQFCHSPPRIDREGLQRIIGMVFDGIAEGQR